MKKLLMIVALMTVAMTACAWTEVQKKKKTEIVQAEALNENGEYERKLVVDVPGVSAQDLYLRALEVLSNWKGSNGKSSSQIDVQDKEGALVIYKGKNYEGFLTTNSFFQQGYYTFSDFTLRIKCKDEKAQLTITVQSMTFSFNNATSVHSGIPLNEIIPVYTHRTDYGFKKCAIKFAPLIPKSMEEMLAVFGEKMKQAPDDDF